MNAPQRGALMLVRFVSVAIIGLGLLTEGLYVADCFAHSRGPAPGAKNLPHPQGPVAISEVHCALLGVPVLAGIVCLAKARPIAQWLSDKLDE